MPNTLGVSIILVMEIFLQDMSYENKHKKVQHCFLKKELSSKGQAKEKKELNIQGFLWVLVQLFELLLSFFQHRKKLFKS
jgi:hypothetical protein